MTYNFISNDPKSRLRFTIIFITILLVILLGIIVKTEWLKVTLIALGLISFFILMINRLISIEKGKLPSKVEIFDNHLLLTINEKQTKISFDDITSYQFDFHNGVKLKIKTKNNDDFKIALFDAGSDTIEEKQAMVTALEAIETEIKNRKPEIKRQPSLYELKWVKITYVLLAIITLILFLSPRSYNTNNPFIYLFKATIIVFAFWQPVYKNHKGLKSFYPNQKIRFL